VPKAIVDNKTTMKNKKTLVLGASENPERYSNMAILRLLSKDQSVVALGQRIGEVSGVKIQAKQVPFTNIDTVTLYLNPTRQRDYYNYIIGLEPKRVIFNPGTENPEFYQLLRSNNIQVEVACTLVLLGTGQY
jgi:predicted CoA-binding protein